MCLQVFVAGSTGRIGLRIVRQLLLAGFKVRAGARNLDKAQSYANLAEEFGIVGSDAIKRLQIVPVDLEDTSTIVAAIGNAGRVSFAHAFQMRLFYDQFHETSDLFLIKAVFPLSWCLSVNYTEPQII